jgi:hypothetical protein
MSKRNAAQRGRALEALEHAVASQHEALVAWQAVMKKWPPERLAAASWAGRVSEGVREINRAEQLLRIRRKQACKALAQAQDAFNETF